MKDEKAKYLIVKASNITKQLYECERVAYCNDFDNIYHKTEKINASEIFAKNNIPEEFQKIIVKINASTFSKKEAFEYTMGFPFDFESRNIEKIENKKYMIIRNKPIYYDGSMFNDKIVMNTEVFYSSFNNVVYLLEELYENGHLENYLQSIKELFDVSLNLDLLFDAWHETHNKQGAMKVYRRKVTSRIV